MDPGPLVLLSGDRGWSQRLLALLEAKRPPQCPCSLQVAGLSEHCQGSHLPVRRMAREQGHEDGHPQECPGSFHGKRFHYERNSEADIIAEIGLEETHELEIEAIRKQQRVNNERLSTLEDQEIARTQREVMLFSMLLSVCIVNLWLWIRQ